jgi:hypothetical protein
MPRRRRALYVVVTTGLIACAVTVVAALILGFAWRRSNGKMRGVRMRSAGIGTKRGSPDGAPGPRVTAADLGQPLGARATLLQFSTAVCAPCRATRRVLAEVAGTTDGVAHVELDAESRLDLVRRLDVRRTPTVFVLGADGEIAQRASGRPRKTDVIAALGQVTAGRVT